MTVLPVLLLLGAGPGWAIRGADSSGKPPRAPHELAAPRRLPSTDVGPADELAQTPVDLPRLESELAPTDPANERLRKEFHGASATPIAERLAQTMEAVAGKDAKGGTESVYAVHRLMHLFDGLAIRKEIDDPSDHVPPADIRAMAAPWRTEVQLKRIEDLRLDPQKPVYIAVYGDSEPGRFVWSRLLFSRHAYSNFRLFIAAVFKKRWMLKRIVDEIERSPAAFAIGLGDFISSGTWGNWRSFFKEWNRWKLEKPHLFVKGNHENRNPHSGKGDARFINLLGSSRNAFDAGPARIVLPDTSGAGLGRRQLRWLREALISNRFKLLFTHKPPSYLHEWTDYGPFKGKGGFKKGVGEFRQLTDRRDLLSRFYGHLHFSAELTEDGRRHRVSGGGGSPLYPAKGGDKTFEWLLLKLTPLGMEEIAYRWVWDEKGRGRFVAGEPKFFPAPAKAAAKADATAEPAARP